MTKKTYSLLKIMNTTIICFLLTGSFLYFQHSRTRFDALSAFSLLAKLQSYGPRLPESDAHTRSVKFIVDQLRSYGWTVEIQSGQVQNHPYQNIFARQGQSPIKVLLGSHYDSRLVADRDLNPLFRSLPVQGANDGGASTAILMELARILPPENAQNIGLAFFDIEDQGNILGWEWIMGSREFVKKNPNLPEKMILLDMVGGHIQTIQPPTNSNTEIYKSIQSVANGLGYNESFVDPSKHGITDDHVPFLEAGVPSVDLIDIIDPNWHTSSDDLENVSISSLQKVGDTLFVWLMTRP
jgi:glutaminyl-peptide cyclotransferase